MMASRSRGAREWGYLQRYSDAQLKQYIEKNA